MKTSPGLTRARARMIFPGIAMTRKLAPVSSLALPNNPMPPTGDQQ